MCMCCSPDAKTKAEMPRAAPLTAYYHPFIQQILHFINSKHHHDMPLFYVPHTHTKMMTINPWHAKTRLQLLRYLSEKKCILELNKNDIY